MAKVHTVKPVLSGHSKINKPSTLMTFCNTFDLHLAIIGLENQFLVFLRVAILDS